MEFQLGFHTWKLLTMMMDDEEMQACSRVFEVLCRNSLLAKNAKCKSERILVWLL